MSAWLNCRRIEMKCMTNRFATAAATAAVALLTLAPAQAADAPAADPNKKLAELFPDKVVARGKGFEVRQSQLEDAFIAFKGSMAARGRPVPDQERASVESNLVDHLVVTQILLSLATPEEKASAKEEADKAIAD